MSHNEVSFILLKKTAHMNECHQTVGMGLGDLGSCGGGDAFSIKTQWLDDVSFITV